MTLKLNGSSSGSVAIDAPASTTGGADITFNLPVADGSSGQAITTNASGQLAFATAGLFSSYAMIEDVKGDDVHGGEFTSGAWRTRDLNTETFDPDGIVSISSNQFTLGAGTYFIKWICPTREVTHHQARLYNTTDSSVAGVGTSEYSDATTIGNSSTGKARITISGSKTFEIQHRCAQTRVTYGFGVGAAFGGEHYTQVEIYKEA